jgi:hypothetical protein
MRTFLVFGTMALIACGGNTEGSDGGGNDGMAPTDGSVGNDSSNGMDGSSGQDSGGGTMSTPGKIDCGMMSCMAGTEVCCVRGGGIMSDAGAMYSCQPPMMQCQGIRLGCDEAADCMMGVCCGGLQGSRCSTMGCGMGTVQLCKTNAECGDAGTCTTYTCPIIGKVTSCTKPFMQCM